MVSDWQGWGQLVEPAQTGGLLELFYPFVGACVRGGGCVQGHLNFWGSLGNSLQFKYDGETGMLPPRVCI